MSSSKEIRSIKYMLGEVSLSVKPIEFFIITKALDHYASLLLIHDERIKKLQLEVQSDKSKKQELEELFKELEEEIAISSMVGPVLDKLCGIYQKWEQERGDK